MIGILFPDVWFYTDETRFYWPRADKRVWKWKLSRSERIVLSTLFDSEPLNKYRIAVKRRLYYTQVRRAVDSLLKKRALEQASSAKWRTGKMSVTYCLTPFGRFLHLYDNRPSVVSGIAQKEYPKCLRELAVHIKSELLDDLVKSVMSVRAEDRRKKHLWELLDIVFEAQGYLADPLWRQPAVSEFVSRAWCSIEDIHAYVRHMPADCRLFLAKTKESLLARISEIDAILIQSQRL